MSGKYRVRFGTCAYCGRGFMAGRPEQRYCSSSCVAHATAYRGGLNRKPSPIGPTPGRVEAHKRRCSQAARIEWLGRMNDRRCACRARGDVRGLLEVAAAYAAGDPALNIHPMKRLAKECREEAGK